MTKQLKNLGKSLHKKFLEEHNATHLLKADKAIVVLHFLQPGQSSQKHKALQHFTVALQI